MEIIAFQITLEKNASFVSTWVLATGALAVERKGTCIVNIGN